MRIKAFTLAEILITIGIIGVVAMFTICVVVREYNKVVVETRLKKFYSVMNSAVRQAEAEYGDWRAWSFSGSETLYEKYLKGYLKVNDVKSVNGYRYYYFSDGSGFYPRYPLSYAVKSEVELLFCPFGFSKCDVTGKNRFSFVFNTAAGGYILTLFKNPIEPYTWKWNGDLNSLKTYSEGLGCINRPATDPNNYCTTLIMLNGWKIPKDYPFKF